MSLVNRITNNLGLKIFSLALALMLTWWVYEVKNPEISKKLDFILKVVNLDPSMVITSPDTRAALKLRRYWWTLKRIVWHLSVLGLSDFASRALSMKKKKKSTISDNASNMELEAGELVEVKSAKEIFSTLDSKAKLNGLPFTKEMMKFCGKRFRVYKRLENILLEATGELRRVKTPTVILEGVFCDGKAHGNCDRSCFCFWREAWLKRIK